MTAYAAAQGGLDPVLGLAFLGFPLHPPGRDGTERWSPMTSISVPMLFLQGDRDRLANLELLEPLVLDLDTAATLEVIEGGDHSFKVLKRVQRSEDEIFDQLSSILSSWASALVASSGNAR